jgi:hypothetical protein
VLLHAAQAAGVSLAPADVRVTLAATGDGRLDPKSGLTKPRANIGRAVESLGTWVDFAYAGAETGAPSQPFNTLGEGVTAVPPGGAITLRGGTRLETLTISKPLKLQSIGGVTTIGQ